MRYRQIKKKKNKFHKDRVSYKPGDKHVLLPDPLRFVMQCFRNFSLSYVADDQTSRCKTSLFFSFLFLDFKFVACVAPPTAFVLWKEDRIEVATKASSRG